MGGSLCVGMSVGCSTCAMWFLCVCSTGSCSMGWSMLNNLYHSEMFLAADGEALFDLDQVPQVTPFTLIVSKERLALTDVLQGRTE